MKLSLLLSSLLIINLNALELSSKQEKNWNFNAKKMHLINYLPLGNFMIEVTTPPEQLHSISLPYEAQIIQLKTALYTHVKKDQLLALVTGKEWLNVQKDAVSDKIELMHHEHQAERNVKLCKEGIIPQKVCIQTEAEYKSDKIQLSASKTLLKAYGATPAMIEKLFSTLTIVPTHKVLSPINGTIVVSHVQPGKNIASSEGLFVIREDGMNWIECDMNVDSASKLHINQKIRLTLDGKSFLSKVIHLSSVINPETQTRHVRFAIKPSKSLLTGLRKSAFIEVNQKVFSIDQKAVIRYEGKPIIFIKTSYGYRPSEVTILGETQDNYYIKFNPKLTQKIATTSVAVLKSLLAEEADE